MFGSLQRALLGVFKMCFGFIDKTKNFKTGIAVGAWAFIHVEENTRVFDYVWSTYKLAVAQAGCSENILSR